MAMIKTLRIFFTLMGCFITLEAFSVVSMQDLSAISLPEYEMITPNNAKQLQQVAKWRADDAVFSPSGTTLAIATDNLIKLIDLSKSDAPMITLSSALNKGRLSFNHDGTRLIYQDSSGKFDLWETSGATKFAIKSLDTIKAFSPTLQLFAATEENTLVLYNLEGSKQQTRIPIDSEIIRLRFSPDETQLAILYQHNLKVWNLSSNSEKLSYTVEKGDMTDAIFSPDGNQLAVMWYGLTSDYSKYTTTIKIWDAKSEQPVGLFAGDGMQYSLKFSPLGNIMSASGSGNNLTDMVRLWDKVSQKEITTLSALSGGGVIAFNSNENLLAVGSGTTPNVEVMNLYADRAITAIVLHSGIGTIKEQFNSSDQLLLVLAMQKLGTSSVSLWAIPKN